MQDISIGQAIAAIAFFGAIAITVRAIAQV
jgi:hypothetical protein